MNNDINKQSGQNGQFDQNKTTQQGKPLDEGVNKQPQTQGQGSTQYNSDSR
jgi:hypothetical protein